MKETIFHSPKQEEGGEGLESEGPPRPGEVVDRGRQWSVADFFFKRYMMLEYVRCIPYIPFQKFFATLCFAE